ncbi:MAG: SMC-Scp complex subunit ScpB, partial [Alphaproteobacteria bacterium]|nr:SMC-Scp complex subunit ScpB [Alphaproteobacteria bacterium]
MDDLLEATRLVEALLFAAEAPVAEAEIARRLPPDVKVSAVIERLQLDYAGRGVEPVQLGGKWAFRTAPDLAPALELTRREERRLTRAMEETLAIIAYHQPITRPEIEAIRGVSVGSTTMDALLDTGWIKPGPRKDVPGRPLTWLTAPAFLEAFGLASLKDLPGLDELRAAGLFDPAP